MFRTFTIVLAVLAGATSARAERPEPSHGRLRDDLTLSAGLGGAAAFEGGLVEATANVELRARLVDTAGLLLGAAVRPEGSAQLVVAVDLRPLFLARFLSNLEGDDRVIDLLVDSIGLDIGFAAGPLGQDGAGLALALGLGFDVPLVFTDDGATGLYLHLGGRWLHAGTTDWLGPAGGIDEVSVLGVLTFRGGVHTGIAAWEGSRAPRPH